MGNRIEIIWPAEKWHNAPWQCRWFGHRTRQYLPYLIPRHLPGFQDGIGKQHVDLQCECDHCGHVSTIARVHNWEEPKK